MIIVRRHRRERRSAGSAFTIIELLIVIAIIVILITILVASLGRAREQARRVKCMANQYTLGQAVQFFAAEHKGFGQVLTRGYATGIHPRRPDSYAYALWPKSFEILSLMGNVLAPWPIAYSSYIGAPGLRTEKLLLALPFPRPVDPQRLTGKAQVDVLQCPSDRDLIGELLSPTSRLYGAISYGINEDVFLQDHSANPRFVGEPPRNVWKNGGWNGVPLQGRLDRVRCPSSVLMFLDFGGVDNYSGWHPNLAFSSGAGGGRPLRILQMSMLTAFRFGVTARAGWLAFTWTGTQSTFERQTRFSPPASEYRQRYSPNPRITPYDPGKSDLQTRRPDGPPLRR